ncbi:patatin-like phospholipase family protein [Micromonospora sp. WMMD812]|uniref:patatin-like phospholipase family protein n=1 Tax=Micromonospora sp. WMMD812 TaxID=3015152 RepID=UPI00248B0B76|nr:patatin-like phospholipase family protein [Micromonospora sp. WMMD812]WBB69065.1 patatin-like phospholipase family protein [Micromonospora sp. WMMD812]
MNGNRRLWRATAALGATAALAAGCSSAASDQAAAPVAERPRVGIVLGGGGETGIAWQTAVLAALGKAGLTPATVDVVVGTSAGALAGSYFSAGLDLEQLVEKERSGDVATAPLPAGKGMTAIPTEIIAALGSTEGTIEERGRKVGALAMKAPTPISSADFVTYVSSMLPGADWPALDFRPTSVNAETGQTVLWKKADGVPLAAAVASSAAVPGFLPTVEINGQHYTDAPRTSFSADLVKEKNLAAIIYIGMPTPNLSNTVEEEALSKLEAGGLRVVRITGGEGSEEIIRNALDPKVRPRAAELGLRDGAAATAAVEALLHP